MRDVEVLESPAAATAALDPKRATLLAELNQPSSAANLAERVGLPRQKVNYHLRHLESLGLVEVAETRRWGGLTERRMVATASSYVVSPSALGPLANDPRRMSDRLSAHYLISLGARVVREVGELVHRSIRTSKRVATLSIDTEIRFRSAADRAAFTRELTATIGALVARYHDPSAPGGRNHRLVIGAHPLLATEKSKETL